MTDAAAGAVVDFWSGSDGDSFEPATEQAVRFLARPEQRVYGGGAFAAKVRREARQQAEE